MGGISLGKSKNKSNQQSQQQSTDNNVNNAALVNNLTPAVGGASDATSMLHNLLAPGPSGFADSNGYKFMLNKGVDQVNSNMASRGLLDSGSDMKGIEDYRQGLTSNYLNNYMSGVNQMGNIGVGSAGILASSGRSAQSTGSSTGTSRGKSKNGSVSGSPPGQ